MGICKADCIWVDGEKMTPLDVSENAVKKSCHELLCIPGPNAITDAVNIGLLCGYGLLPF